LDIPAGEENYELTSSFTTPVDIELIGVGAHMHYLGHTAKATATLPDGTTKPLFYIDEWDFNWQGDYFYETPVRLPAGTTVKGVVTFDNSAENPHNPSSPPRRVRWGLESTDEMGSVNFRAVPVNESDVQRFQDAVRNQIIDEIRITAEKRFNNQSDIRENLVDRLRKRLRDSRGDSSNKGLPVAKP
ncbi:MAG: hypothetical protein ACPGR8_06160, partial [Limisphaerales bacterium]